MATVATGNGPRIQHWRATHHVFGGEQEMTTLRTQPPLAWPSQQALEQPLTPGQLANRLK